MNKIKNLDTLFHYLVYYSMLKWNSNAFHNIGITILTPTKYINKSTEISKDYKVYGKEVRKQAILPFASLLNPSLYLLRVSRVESSLTYQGRDHI